MGEMGRMARLRLAVSRVFYPHLVHRYQLNRLSPSDWFTQVIILIGFASPVALNIFLTPAQRRSGWLLIGVYILINVLKARKQLLPEYQRKAKENYEERKTRLTGVMHRMALWETERDPHDFQRECLYLIANYARSWRFDLGAKVIFANLLVRDPSDSTKIKVIARDRERLFGARQVPVSCDIDRVAVAKCLDTGDVIIIDDLRIERPQSKGKPYRSILGVPLRSLDQKQVLGVLSIDSSEVCHFRNVANELVWSLQPYILALEFSLDRGVVDYAP